MPKRLTKEHRAIRAARRFLPRGEAIHPAVDLRLWASKRHVWATDGARAIVLDAPGLGADSEKAERSPPVFAIRTKSRRARLAVKGLRVADLRRLVKALPRKTAAARPITEHRADLPEHSGVDVSWKPLRIFTGAPNRGSATTRLQGAYLADLVAVLTDLRVATVDVRRTPTPCGCGCGCGVKGDLVSVAWDGGWAAFMSIHVVAA